MNEWALQKKIKQIRITQRHNAHKLIDKVWKSRCSQTNRQSAEPYNAHKLISK